MRTPILLSILIATVPGCGGGGGDAADARPTADAAPRTVNMVACAGTPPVVTNVGSTFSPMSTTINAGGMVHFTLTSTHNVMSTTTGQTFSLAFGGDACLQFDAPGTFTFRCSAHGFTGTVVVQ